MTVIFFTRIKTREIFSRTNRLPSGRTVVTPTQADAPRGSEMTNALQEHFSVGLRESIERRLAFLLKTNDIALLALIWELSLIELLNGIFLLVGQSETVGAYAGAVKFIIAVVGKDEAWRRPEKPEREADPEQLEAQTEPVH
jgi:hypothetical protein